MLRLLIPVLFLVLGLGGGVTAGLLLNTPDPVAEFDVTDQSGVETSDEDDTNREAAGTGSATRSESTEFVRLNNQFVVPIVHHGSVRSLVVLALTIEVPLGDNEAVFDREPRLRDAFLRAMFAHANAGGFDGSFTEAAAMAPLRRALRDAARGILGDVALDVLIVDINRQDA